MKNSHKEYLRYDYTEEEMSTAGKDLARAAQTRATLEQRKKEVDASLKAQIEEQNSLMARLSQLINTGFEYRDIECRVDLDTPEPGKKRVVRLDTGEEVKVILMTDQDRQMALDLQEQAEAEERAKAEEEARKPKQLNAPTGEKLGEGFTARPVDGSLNPEVLT